MSRRIFFGFVALAALGVGGCPGPTFIVQQYRGDPRPSETIAMLRVNGSDSVRLLVLDDEDVAAPIVSDGRLHIEMLPGHHTLVVANSNAPRERFAPLVWQAEPNKVYRVVFVAADVRPRPRVFEVERDRDVVVRDVTLTTPNGPMNAPRRVAPLPSPSVDAADHVPDAAADTIDGGDAGPAIDDAALDGG